MTTRSPDRGESQQGNPGASAPGSATLTYWRTYLNETRATANPTTTIRLTWNQLNDIITFWNQAVTPPRFNLETEVEEWWERDRLDNDDR
jgi:hypothetical protein